MRGGILAVLLFLSTAHTAAGARPFFQAPYSCGQVWDISTYDGHSPDEDSLDMSLRHPTTNARMTEDEPVLAMAAGEVVNVFTKSNDVIRVYVEHADGWETQYLHLPEEPPLNIGDKVVQGQVLSRVGKSGTTNPHLHVCQKDGSSAVRQMFADKLVETHEADATTWGKSGKSDCEELMSLNCAGESFMPWDWNGKNYNLIYKPSSGLVKTVVLSAAGTSFTTKLTTTFSLRWTHFVPYAIGSNMYFMTYAAGTGAVTAQQINSVGTSITNLAGGTWSKSWTTLVPIRLGNHPHIIVYSSLTGQCKVERVNNNGIFTTTVYNKFWIAGRTQILPYIHSGVQYVLLYKGGDGKAKIFRVDLVNGVPVFTNTFDGQWSTGWTHMIDMNVDGKSYLLAYKAETGFAGIYNWKYGGTGVSYRYSSWWQKTWTHITPFHINHDGHFVLYNADSGNIRTYRVNTGGTSISRLSSRTWTRGWN